MQTELVLQILHICNNLFPKSAWKSGST